MAGDWIPMRIGLHEDPSVRLISKLTGIDPFGVVGRLHRVWGWFDMNTRNGVVEGSEGALIDEITSVTGFANAMVTAGWLCVTANGLKIPSFSTYHGKCAKRRALTAARMRKHRAKHRDAGDASLSSPLRVTRDASDALREEKRRESSPPAPPRTPEPTEKDTPPTPLTGGGRVGDAPTNAPPVAPRPRNRRKEPPAYSSDFLAFWSAYPRRTGKGAAWAAWNRAALPDSSAILAAIEIQKRSDQWSREAGQFIPHPATWINQRRWEDDSSISSGNGRHAKPLAAVPAGHPCYGRHLGDTWDTPDGLRNSIRPDGFWWTKDIGSDAKPREKVLTS